MSADKNNLDTLIYRIINGKYSIRFNRYAYIIKQPSLKIRAEASIIYDDIMRSNRFQHWVSIEECHKRLVFSGVLRPDFVIFAKKLEQKLENYKIELYESFTNVKKQKRIRVWINNIHKQIRTLDNIKHSLRSFTLEGFADMVKYEHIFTHLLYDAEEEMVPKSRVSEDLLTRILNTSMLSQKEYRKVARSNNWRTYHKTAATPFPDFKYLTDEQQQLLSYCNMYDNIYQNPECPPDDIIEDDDMLDGWMLLQKREAEKAEQEERGNSVANKHANAQDIFVMAESDEDRAKIDDMNSSQSRMIKQQREGKLKNQGEVKGGEFHDQKLKLFNESQEQYLQTVRNKS